MTADQDDLRTLEAEARRQGVAVARLLREAVHEKAAEIRERRRPRVAIDSSSDGKAARQVAASPVARPPR